MEIERFFGDQGVDSTEGSGRQGEIESPPEGNREWGVDHSCTPIALTERICQVRNPKIIFFSDMIMYP